MERNHEDDGPTYALSAGAKRIESGLVLINALPLLNVRIVGQREVIKECSSGRSAIHG
jgi:hypothetical protein